jgi:hypothetical protein
MAGAFLYLGILLYRSGLQVGMIPWKKYGEAGFLALLLYLFSLLVQFAVWGRMLSFYHQVGWQDAAIFSKALVLRRLPGGIWHWVGRATMYSGTTRVPGKVVLQANFVEWVMLLLVAAGISVAGVSAIPWIARGPLSLLLLSCTAGLAYWWQPGSRSPALKAAEAFLWTALYIISWISGGLIVLIFSMATGDTGLSWANAIWIWAVTGGSSLFLIIIPAGLGIREIALTWLLNPYFTPADSMIIAVLLRFTFTAADFLWGMLGWVIGRRYVRDEETKDPVL